MATNFHFTPLVTKPNKKAISLVREAEAIWNLPEEFRQEAYDALRAKYGKNAPIMDGPGIRN